MSSTYLTKTFSGAGNRKKWTWSAWVKKHQESGSSTYNTPLFGTAGSSYDTISFLTTPNAPKFFCNVAGNFERQTNALHRDCFGWYHLVITFDSNQSTATDRLKMYINGVQESSFSDNTNGSQDADSYINSTDAHQIGKQQTLSRYGDFSMSHIHFCDGYAYAASDFGQTDSVTGEWSIKTSPSVSYGTNGFFILKDGNSLTDQSPNTNNWSVGGGTLTKTEDNPSNIFCTYNRLQQTNGSASFGNGNTYFTHGTQWLGVNGTLAATSGKYYAEFKVQSNAWGVGVADVDSDAGQTRYLSDANNGYQSKYTGGKQIFLNGSTIIAQENNSTVVNNAGMGNTSFANNDIVTVALDLDNNNLFFGKNGTWLRGATESEIEAGTSTNATFSGTSFNDKFWTWSVTTENTNIYMNAGNGYFGTTAVSSAGTNASNNGIFEYDVPAGFTALSTKGLNL